MSAGFSMMTCLIAAETQALQRDCMLQSRRNQRHWRVLKTALRRSAPSADHSIKDSEGEGAWQSFCYYGWQPGKTTEATLDTVVAPGGLVPVAISNWAK